MKTKRTISSFRKKLSGREIVIFLREDDLKDRLLFFGFFVFNVRRLRAVEERLLFFREGRTFLLLAMAIPVHFHRKGRDIHSRPTWNNFDFLQVTLSSTQYAAELTKKIISDSKKVNIHTCTLVLTGIQFQVSCSRTVYTA